MDILNNIINHKFSSRFSSFNIFIYLINQNDEKRYNLLLNYINAKNILLMFNENFIFFLKKLNQDISKH